MLKKVARVYLKIVEAICVCLLAAILVCMCIQIVCRIFTIGQSFTEEFSRLCFSLMIFVGAPLCFAEGADIVVDMLVNVLPPAVQKVTNVISYALIALFSVLAFRSELTVISANKSVTAVSMTWIKMNWLYYAFLVSFALLFVVAIVKIVMVLTGRPQIMDINEEEKKRALAEAKEMDLGI